MQQRQFWMMQYVTFSWDKNPVQSILCQAERVAPHLSAETDLRHLLLCCVCSTAGLSPAGCPHAFAPCRRSNHAVAESYNWTFFAEGYKHRAKFAVLWKLCSLWNKQLRGLGAVACGRTTEALKRESRVMIKRIRVIWVTLQVLVFFPHGAGLGAEHRFTATNPWWFRGMEAKTERGGSNSTYYCGRLGFSAAAGCNSMCWQGESRITGSLQPLSVRTEEV